jgi:putative nucleotidyltransferase with HDIG domain
MKNGTQKNKPKTFKERLAALAARRKEYSSQSESMTFLLILGLISALIMQQKIDPSFFMGSMLIAVALYYIFFKDIRRYKPVFMNERKLVYLLGMLLVSTLFIGKSFDYLNSSLNRGFGFPDSIAAMFGTPIPVGAMLVALIFDFHTALIFALVISLLTGISFDNPYLAVYVYIGSLTAAFSVMRCKKRSALIKGGMHVSLVSIVVAGMVLLLTSNLFSAAAPAAFLFAAMSGFFVIAIVSITLPVIEYTFGISTDISLLELLNLDQPLMRNMMISAPGTYHHCFIVGNLAEAAAEGVGANPLLARVSSYFHDIGKMRMPDYFIENQQSGDSRHERLAPHMSSIILISHVKEGVELARQYKLPQAVIDIIQQHHGTRTMAYFYQKAKDQAGGGPVNDEDYRYPGPKPRTRVAALVMMADAVEASARALTDPTPARISALVEKIINEIFIDGQIAECELTLKDISEIKKRFTHVLTSIFHRRIEYPDAEMRALHHRTENITDKGSQGNGSIGKEQAKGDKDRSVRD